jgi:hypothetical protein
VITYDFLNQRGGGSQWMYIEVLAHPDSDGLLPDFFLSDSGAGLPIDKSEDYEQVHLEQVHSDVKVDMFLSAAWMPSFTIYQKGNRFNGQNLSLASVTGRFGLLWDKPYYFNPGLELAASYSFFEQAHLLTFGLNLLLLRGLPGETMALTFRLGAGYNVLLNQGGAFHTNMGISFLLFVTDQRNKFRMYLETGLDYAYWFSAPPANIFRPWIVIGWRL